MRATGNTLVTVTMRSPSGRRHLNELPCERMSLPLVP